MLDTALGGVWPPDASRAGEGRLHVLIPCSKKTLYTRHGAGEGGGRKGRGFLNQPSISGLRSDASGLTGASRLGAKEGRRVTEPSTSH